MVPELQVVNPFAKSCKMAPSMGTGGIRKSVMSGAMEIVHQNQQSLGKWWREKGKWSMPRKEAGRSVRMKNQKRSGVSVELIVFVVSHSLSPFLTEGKSTAKSIRNGLSSLQVLEGNGGSRKGSSSCRKGTATGTRVVKQQSGS